MFGGQAGYLFAAKCLTRSHVFKVLVFLYAYTCFIVAYMLRICEVPVSSDQTKGLTTLPNALWNAIITMTTVGYGEISTTTPFGKVVAVMAALCGG